MVTCYDYPSAKIVSDSEIDAVLVGDSVAMVVHGFEDTISATSEMMILHTQAVKRGLSGKFLISDMPFLSYRKGLAYAMDTVEALMKAGAQAIKIEGVDGNIDIIKHIIQSGVPVMGHLGLTPQFVNVFGGYKVQGKTETHAQKIFEDARALEDIGCFSVVLECVPSDLAQRIAESTEIPIIGIGAGPYTDGQILVWHDVLRIQKEFQPKFVRSYLDGADLIVQSLNDYVRDIESNRFPNLEESFS